MGILERLFRRLGQSDEERRTDELRGWAASVGDTVRIAEVRERAKVRVAGVVRRLTLYPGGEEGGTALSAVITDGTGELTARWVGRGQIQGVRLGCRLVLEGLAARERGALRMVNPRYEFV